MTWFKVDDSFYDHLKVFDAPDCAVALWVRAGTWAARNLTDGFVPSGMPARLCDDADTAVKELVRRKLWLRVKDGYRFHDWKKYQPTRESVEHDREQATERKRRERERKLEEKTQARTGPVTHVSRRDTPVTTPVTHAPVTSPRPDPTLNTSTPDGVEGSAEAEQPPREGQEAFAGMPNAGDATEEKPKKRAPRKTSVPAGAEGVETEGQRTNRVAKTYTDRVKLTDFMGARGVVHTALTCGEYTEAQVLAGLDVLAGKKDPLTRNSLRNAIKPPSWADRNLNGNAGRSTRHRLTDSRSSDRDLSENF